MTKYKSLSSRRCVFNCQNYTKLFSFPDQADFRRLWLEKLGLVGKDIYRNQMYVCLNHFSARQLSYNGRTITPISIPDKNIPGKHSPNDQEETVIKPLAAIQSLKNSDNKNSLHDIKQCVMITSDSSKCYLKCKTYKNLHRFPSDLLSYNIWLQKLDVPETHKLIRTASLCDNHFSPAMRTSKTISRTAVPDIYLPSQCKFINEFDMPSEDSVSQTSFDDKMISDQDLQLAITALTNDASMDAIVDSEKEEPMEVQESFKANNFSNSSTNIQSIPPPHSTVIIQPTITEILSNQMLGIDDSSADNEDTTFNDPSSEVICPESSKIGSLKCVLKCTNYKTLFRFPNTEERRTLWLKKVGLTHCYCTSRICDRHFSEIMFSQKRLSNSAYPDINLPEPTQIVKPGPPPEIQEIPQFICVLTVLTHNWEIKKIVNKTKYIEHKVDKTIPSRERSVQVDMVDLKGQVNVGILADEDFDDDEMEVIENINFEQCPDLVSNKSIAEVYPSKSQDMFECLKCGEITLDQESIEKHLHLHENMDHRLCFYCGRKFRNGMMLKIHEKKVHCKAKFTQVQRCPKEHCKKAFHSRKKLDEHLNEHIRPAKHYCINCNRLFLSSLKLSCHLLACRPRIIKSRLK